jgi:hypothetical protein
VRHIAVAYPMHSQYKLSNEGYRTRDGHVIEWLGRLATQTEAHIGVVSRPEPIALAPLRRIRGSIAAGTIPVQTLTWSIPRTDPKHWWVRSAHAYPKTCFSPDVPSIVWNPFTATAPTDRNPFTGGRTVALDLLDDWTIHYAFSSIRSQVEDAYRRAFDASSVVFANSEGTLELAHRFGRPDAQLLTNGVDPDRFATRPNARGRLTVGYVGKIGKRLDARLISEVCNAFPDLRFVFAGPFSDVNDKYRTLLSRIPNVELLNDVHYDRVPALMSTFDLGWVPHAVGEGEVGGDVIKTYEYRATGLQVLTTPVIGAGRTLTTGVHVIPADQQVAWLREAIGGRDRMERVPAVIPEELTWKFKALHIAHEIGVRFANEA